jgi:hypothetical protein
MEEAVNRFHCFYRETENPQAANACLPYKIIISQKLR